MNTNEIDEIKAILVGVSRRLSAIESNSHINALVPAESNHVIVSADYFDEDPIDRHDRMSERTRIRREREKKIFLPPPKNVVGQGRANIANHPVFYVADMPLEAIIETDENYLTKSFYVACWKYPGTLTYSKYLYHPNGSGTRITKDFQEAYQTIKEKHPRHSPEAHRRTHEFQQMLLDFLFNCWGVSFPCLQSKATQ